MVAIITNQGLSAALQNFSAVSGASSVILSLAADNATGTTLAAHTKLNDITSTSVSAKALATNTETTRVLSMTCTFGTSDANFAIGRFSAHGTASGSVTVSSTGLYAAVDGFSITKTSAFTLALTFKITATSV